MSLLKCTSSVTWCLSCDNITPYKHRHHLHHLLALARRYTYDAAAQWRFIYVIPSFRLILFLFSFMAHALSGPKALTVPAISTGTGTLRFSFRLLDCCEKSWEVLVSEAGCLQRHFTSASQNSLILSLVSVCARAANETPAKFLWLQVPTSVFTF